MSNGRIELPLRYVPQFDTSLEKGTTTGLSFLVLSLKVENIIYNEN